MFRRSLIPRDSILTALARAFLAGDPTVAGIIARASRTLDRQWRWLAPLASRYLAAFADRTRPRERDVVAFLVRDKGFRRAWLKYGDELAVGHWVTEPQQIQPAAAARDWPVPAIESTSELASWLQITAGELDWFADLRTLTSKPGAAPRLHHYYYRALAKRPGGIRLIEAPKSRLKELQRRILAGILERVPVHPSVHGFVKARSIKSFASPHAGQRVVLRMDLQEFFPSIRAARVQALFRTLGYPEAVAAALMGLCTNVTPRRVRSAASGEVDLPQLWEIRAAYARRHLPQGAPTSPALANLCAYHADCRLAGLARSAGARYTRYADDLAFSGGADFERSAERFSTHVAAILFEEGFHVHHRKTRIMRQGVRQYLAGVIANQHVNVIRADFDRLKAILTNCARHGPESQNRAGHESFRLHLEGRVAFVEMINPGKGLRLRELLERIVWR